MSARKTCLIGHRSFYVMNVSHNHERTVSITNRRMKVRCVDPSDICRRIRFRTRSSNKAAREKNNSRHDLCAKEVSVKRVVIPFLSFSRDESSASQIQIDRLGRQWTLPSKFLSIHAYAMFSLINVNACSSSIWKGNSSRCAQRNVDLAFPR